jgi:hypothetical protein
VIQLDHEHARSEKHGTAATKPFRLVVGFVEAARLLGGQPFVFFLPPDRAKFALDTESGNVYY